MSAVFLIGSIAACGNDSGNGSTGSTDGGQYCNSCDTDESPYACGCYEMGVPIANGYTVLCGDGSNDAASNCAEWCEFAFPEQADEGSIEGAPCSDSDPSGSCTGWDPAAEVSYSAFTGIYSIDEGFVASVVSDPAPLWTCDDVTVDGVAAGDGFEINDADSGELLYELGLRDGDVLVEINGMPLDTYFDAVAAYFTLWIDDEETSYTLEVLRGTSTIYLNYTLTTT